MALHVLQLGPYPPPEGGVSRNMLAIRECLLDSGAKCSIIATSKSSKIVREPEVYHPSTPFELLALLRSIRYDVLHLHLGGDINSKVLGLALATTLFAGKRSVLTIHSGAFPLARRAVSAKPTSIAGYIFRRFGRIIAVNDAIADVFMRYGVAQSVIRKILPFDLRRPDQDVAVPELFAKFIGHHSPSLIAVGGLEKDYDPLFQIAAMADILRTFPDAGLMIVGDGSLRAEVERAIAKSGYPKNIMLPGNVPHSVTLHLIEQSDILLRTTIFDGDAISIREALFLGTPVIATDNGMRPDGVDLISVGDRNALLRKIDDLYSGKVVRQTTEFADDRNIRQVIEVYEELL